MILTPAVTATVTGEYPKLAALRTELSGRIEAFRDGLKELADRLTDENFEWASHYTADLGGAQQHVDSAWRSLGYARDIIEGK